MGNHRLQAADQVRDHDPNPAAHLDDILMSELSAVQQQIAQYVLRFRDAEAGRTEPISVSEELALADCIAAAAAAIRIRARRHQLEKSARGLTHGGPR